MTRPNGLGETSLDVAIARQHDDVAALLRSWCDAWGSWTSEDLSVLAALYNADRFDDELIYLRKLD